MLLRKYFATSFTFNRIVGIKNALQLHPYTSKSYVKDYINFQLRGNISDI